MTNQLFNYTLSTLLFLFFLTIFSIPADAQTPSEDRQFYQIKVYHLNDHRQEKEIDNYLKQAYLPALHRASIKPVGVFKPVDQDTTSDRRVYVMTPFDSLDRLAALSNILENDERYLADGASYIYASHNQAPFESVESVILRAFSHAPQIKTSNLNVPKSQRIYELRSYESATEALNINKVEMFNEGGEVEIFDRLGFNAVFYGNVISGSNMPNLMYMTTFENRKSRDAHWDSFRDDPQWKELSAMDKYRNNVSHIDIYFLRPAEYSDL